jgi:hypothetical protein
MPPMYEKAEHYNTQGMLECSESNSGERERKFHAIYFIPSILLIS